MFELRVRLRYHLPLGMVIWRKRLLQLHNGLGLGLEAEMVEWGSVWDFVVINTRTSKGLDPDGTE